MLGSKGTITERRLRPLWYAIDTRNYKSALKLATALLAKHPDSTYAVVLLMEPLIICLAKQQEI